MEERSARSGCEGCEFGIVERPTQGRLEDPDGRGLGGFAQVGRGVAGRVAGGVRVCCGLLAVQRGLAGAGLRRDACQRRCERAKMSRTYVAGRRVKRLDRLGIVVVRCEIDSSSDTVPRRCTGRSTETESDANSHPSTIRLLSLQS